MKFDEVDHLSVFVIGSEDTITERFPLTLIASNYQRAESAVVGSGVENKQLT